MVSKLSSSVGVVDVGARGLGLAVALELLELFLPVCGPLGLFLTACGGSGVAAAGWRRVAAPPVHAAAFLVGL